MRKLGILVMAMVLVFGMSLGVMADMPDSQDVGVDITFSENALVEIDEDIAFEVIPGSTEGEDYIDEHSSYGSTTDFRVESNTDFIVRIEDNVTSAIRNEFDGIGYTDVTENSEDWYDGSAWIFFNAEFLDDVDVASYMYGVDDDDGEYRVTHDSGVLDTELQANLNLDLDKDRAWRWTNLDADTTVNGTILVTVEAQ